MQILLFTGKIFFFAHTQELLGETPWGSCEGQSLANSLVHWEDVSILENMWLEAQVSQNPKP